tara:strand:+ start:857 stop:1213 length:357 start_codon:yes stop_codon:yes gene_type:complete
MALGNSNSVGKARGKNIGVKVKRTREVKAATNFIAFQGSALQSSAACPLHNSNVNITYYHDGTTVMPQAGDKIYTRKRLNDKFILTNENKFIKVGPNRGRYFNVNYKSGVINSIDACP